MTHPQTWRLGLTGGIGSGKSTVAAMLHARGALVIDADAISRGLTQAGGAAMHAIGQTFGPGFVTAEGALDRDAMRQLVFDQPAARQRLEAIIHPLVAQETARRVETATRSGVSCVVFDIPLLVESGRWRSQLDAVLVVDCREEVQIERVMQRNGWSRESVHKVMSSQASRARRLQAADVCIANDGLSLDQLDRVVAQAWEHFGL